MTAVTDGPFKIKNRGTVLILLFTAIVASGLFFLMQLHNMLNYSFATVRTDNLSDNKKKLGTGIYSIGLLSIFI